MSKPTFEDLVAQLNAMGEPGGEAANDPKAKTRARILRAANETFVELGYRRASVDEVARRSGVAKGTVYVHFKSKSELMLHVLIEEKKRFIGPFRDLFGQKLGPVERLRRAFELFFAALSDSPLTLRMMSRDRDLMLFLEDLPPEMREELLGRQMQGMTVLLEGVDIPEDEREDRLLAFRGVLYAMGHMLAARDVTGLSAARYAQQLAKILVDGVRAK